ncbi:MAG: hypothetical protein ABSC64_09325 [Candidatus Korobacteraceae bacterium]|jgi:hypothetical protein
MARGEWESTTRLIEQAAEILAAENPMTIRQLFYRLVSIAVIDNSRADYQRVSSLLTKARNDGRVDFDHIVDRSRPEYMPYVFDDAAEYARVISAGYRKDYWAMQPWKVEIWCEKDSIIGSIEDLTNELGVTVRVGRGFLSTTKAHELAEFIKDSDKLMSVFYLGDHDPSGRNIESDLYDRIHKYGATFTIKRLAIHASDIAKFKLPPLRVKATDSRATGFLRRYSNKCVELDALPPNELRRRIEQAVKSMRDDRLWSRAIRVEKVELNSIKEFAAQWPS